MDDFTRHRVRKIVRAAQSDQALMTECAGEFGRLIARAMKEHDLPIEAAFEVTREHFKAYGAAMVEFGNLVTAQMCPPEWAIQLAQKLLHEGVPE